MTDGVSEDADRQRYELFVAGRLMGFLTYRVVDGVWVLDHAEIDPAQRGQGRGAQLVGGALDDLRRRGVVVEPACPFVARFIREHPEYGDLVASP